MKAAQLADIWPIVVIAFVVGLALLGACAALQSGANEPPHIPADVDLPQCLATTCAIAYGHGKGRA